MISKLFINLPVQDLQKSIGFFTQLGFTFNPQFTDETGTCMIISDTMFAMLLTHEKFQTFTNKDIADAEQTTEVLLALEVESREKVDEIITKAVEAGGSIYRQPEDHGWMYERSFADLDGHQWEIFFMDASAMPKE